MCQGFLDTVGESLMSFDKHSPESSKVLGALMPTCSGQRGGIGGLWLKRSGWAWQAAWSTARRGRVRRCGLDSGMGVVYAQDRADVFADRDGGRTAATSARE